MCLGSEKIFHLPSFKCPSSPFLTKVLLWPIIKPERTTKQTTRCGTIWALLWVAAKSKMKMETFSVKKTWMLKWLERPRHKKHPIHTADFILHMMGHAEGLTHLGTLWPHVRMRLQRLGEFSRAGCKLGEGSRCWVSAVHRGKPVLC